MEFVTTRIREPLRTVMALRRCCREIPARARVLLYRADDDRDGIALIGDLTRTGETVSDPLGIGGMERPFGIAIESGFVVGHVAVYWGDAALKRTLGQDLTRDDDEPDIFASPIVAAAEIAMKLQAEAAMLALSGKGGR